MTKIQFLLALGERLSGLPKEEMEERLRFYSEMIEDRMEEGLSEEEAVAAVGSVEEIGAQLGADTPSPKTAKEPKSSKRKMPTWAIVLLIVGSPLWLSLLIAAFAVALSLYAALWSVILALWAVFGALVVSGFSVTLGGIGVFCMGKEIAGLAMIGAGLVLAGLSIFFFFGCKAATKGAAWLTKIWARD
ncbi:MAG: DUF1700 domain-containing protein [Clostridia bacterium]|nr:DUF1700 domain-containing protein [Clostridia bacterium]